MANSEFATVQAALERLNPKDQTVCQGLGLTERQAELFWAALSAVSENGGLAIPDLNKLAAKLVKFPSPYINELKKRGAVQRGKKKREWNITAKAIRKLNSLLTGEVIPAEKTAERVTKRGKAVQKKLSQKLTKTTVGELVRSLNDRLAELETNISKLTAERDDIKRAIRIIVAACR